MGNDISPEFSRYMTCFLYASSMVERSRIRVEAGLRRWVRTAVLVGILKAAFWVSGWFRRLAWCM